MARLSSSKGSSADQKIVRSVSGSFKPVTVRSALALMKIRQVDVVEIAKRVEDAGAAAIAVHGRTRQQYYSGQADWDAIRKGEGSGDYSGDRKRNIVSTGNWKPCLKKLAAMQ